MSHVPKVLDALARVISYPDDRTVQAAELLFVVLQAELPEAAAEASRFGAFVESCEPWEVEEEFTSTFDVNPACALEVGWHLFGEEYARGMFLVRMRQEMRKYDLPESTELPDHLTHVLAVLAAMPDEEADRFAQACVLPAVGKMKAALADKETAYRHLVVCLDLVLRHVWGEPAQDNDPRPRTAAGRPLESDPLQSFPVADVGCHTSCSAPVELVALEIPACAAPETTRLNPEDSREGNPS